MKYPNLFSSYNNNGLTLKNRFLMAPMTRSRSTQPGDIPNELMRTYYEQRTSAGIIISEATQISLQGKGYAQTPGIYSQEQIDGWKKITGAVHENGSKMILQLWHVGRVSNSKVNGLQPIAPSAIEPGETSVYIFEGLPDGSATFISAESPRAMEPKDFEVLEQDFVQASKNAIEADFDGVEIHGANGYLLDKFLRGSTNFRTDEYGGSKENKVRLLVKITAAVAAAIGPDKVGVRMSPFLKADPNEDPEILDTILLAAEQLNKLGIAYIHIAEPDWGSGPKIEEQFRKTLRRTFTGTIVLTGGKTPEIGEKLLEKGYADLIGFGRNFIANPDFPHRVFHEAELNEITDGRKLFGGGDHVGYTDYAPLNENL